MKIKILLTLLTILIFSGNIFSQDKKEVVNGKIKQTDFSDTKVTLKYELPSGDFPNIPYKVSFKVKTESEEINVLVGLSGDHGDNIRPSENLSLTWNFTEEGFVKSDIKDSEMSITGTRTVPPVNITPTSVNLRNQKKVKLPSMIMPSSIVAVGIGVFGYGVSQELKAQDDYDFYKENTMAEEVVNNITITDALRTQYFEDAKSKRKQGIAAMAVGGLVSAAGVYLLMKKITARKEAKKRLSFQPDIKINNNASTSFGGRIVFRF